MRKFLFIAAMCLPFIAGRSEAIEFVEVNCTTSTIALTFSDDVSITDGTVTSIEVGENMGSMDGSLTIGSTLVQTLSDKITVNLSSADQSTFSTALNGNCYVKTNSAFTGVSSSVLRDSQ